MKSSKTTISDSDTRRSQLWEVLLVREDGHWAGFRLGLKTLRKLSNYLVLILCLLALSITGWAFARWKMSDLREKLSFSQLELESVSFELNRLKGAIVVDPDNENTPLTLTPVEDKEISTLPSLDARDRHSAVLDLTKFSAKFQGSAKRVELNFSLERLPPKEGKRKLYWILLLHGPQGILSYPKAISSESRDLILFHRGESLELSKTTKKVNAQFRVENFVEQAGAEPVYASLLVYDDKGSLLSRQRRSLEILQ